MEDIKIIKKIKEVNVEVEDQNRQLHTIQYSNFINIENVELTVAHNYENSDLNKCKICLSLECGGYSIEIIDN